MVKYLLLLTSYCFIATSCISVTPYIEIGMAYDMRHTCGNNPIGIARFGVNYKQHNLAFEHTSSTPDGFPFNNHRDRETMDTITYTYHFDFWGKGQ